MKAKIAPYNKTHHLLMLLILLSMSSCKKFVEIDPPINQITGASAFSTDATATAAIVGIYSRLSQSGIIKDITPYSSMYADELINYTEGNPSEFAKSQLTLANSPSLNALWSAGYQNIYPANLAIEKLSQSESLSPAIKTSLSAEAKFLRAYLYLQLSNLFGDLPLVEQTNYTQTSQLPKTPRAQLLRFIISDLQEAATTLPDRVDPEKIRANRWSAKALLARAYLYDGQYALAEKAASEVIESNKYSLAGDLNKVFLKNSTEAILQLYPTQANQNTLDGPSFLPATATETPKYYLTSSLLNAFEAGDLRKTAWISSRIFLGQTYYYPSKYKVINSAVLTEYQTILRLSEMYLIRAEAEIQQGQIPAGIKDLNTIRKRARASATSNLPNPLPDLVLSLNQTEALLAAEKERRMELMNEMGHRWIDLKRTGRAGAVLALLKPATWKDYAINWPLPDEQLRLNPSLTQNEGYTK
ncbi:RagB/SusD family nutrient uptake outer membrane protein [Pedobacter psychrotolerans]|uniref:RagB/SusD family nutrient uptake outer membrane protein n=1 Tax=Pedobacter psychrotolerans TaxID=1843235 RepID=UPI003F9B67AE